MYQLTAVKPKSLALQSLPSVQSQQFRCNRQPKARIDQLVVFSRDEGKQALLYGSDNSIIRIIGDIRDYDKLNVSIKRSNPDIIIHTAALKRIDDMEFYPDECVKTNINGSENVAIAAEQNDVKKCILISTDKACQPVNVYGSSKFIAERIFTNYDYNSTSTIFASVRYGNVIASRGSFIPLWLEMIKKCNLRYSTGCQLTYYSASGGPFFKCHPVMSSRYSQDLRRPRHSKNC